MIQLRITNYELRMFLEELFYFLSVSLAVGFILELIFPRIVLAYFNLSYLLLVWLIFGIILLVISKKK